MIIALTFGSCETEDKKPNIIFIMSDDHTSQAISAYGGRLADICPTPNIDRIAEEGMMLNYFNSLSAIFVAFFAI